jgi:hypothetical protein
MNVFPGARARGMQMRMVMTAPLCVSNETAAFKQKLEIC